MSRIFISYRRDDSASISGRIYDRLVAKFGRKRVFKDVDDIPAGVDFNAYIHNTLRQCTVALVVIGRRWLDIQDADGRQRLAQPNDLVRIEIETALSLGLTVIPVLAEGATMPAPPDVPESLRELTRLNALPARIDPDFAHDMDKVISAVEYAFSSHTSPDIFRRVSVAMSKPKPSVEAVVDADASLPGTSPQLAATSATLPPSTPTRVPTPAHTKRTAATSMKKPPLIVGLSALVIVTIIAGYFSLQGLRLPLGGPKTTRTSLSPTATIAATPTQEPARLPFRAVSPGPGCDRQNSWAAYYWRLYVGRTTINCPVDKPYTELHTCYQNSICQSGNGVVFLLGALALQSHPHYIISVQTSRMSSNAGVEFDLSNSSLRFTISASAGQYDASWTENNSYHDIRQGPFDSRITHTFAFDFNGKAVTALLDGISIASRTLPFVPILGEATMFVFGQGGQADASADFANFSVVSK